MATHQHNHNSHDNEHSHTPMHDHSEPGHSDDVANPGDHAIQSAFSVGLFLLKGLILVVMLVWVFSGVYKIENGESAVEMYLGKINPYNGNNVRTENLYWSFPFPFTEVIKVQTKKENSIRVEGFPINPNEVYEPAEDPLVKGQRNYYITKDMNFLHLGWNLTYRIKELDKFMMLFYEKGDINQSNGATNPWEANAQNLIVQISRGVMLEECTHQNAMEILTGRNLNQIVKERVQVILDKMGSGIELTSLNLGQAVPPSSVKKAFFDVLVSKDKKAQMITESQKKKEEILLAIQSEAKKIELESQNEIDLLKHGIKAEASRVQTISQLFKNNPIGLKNYLHQLYLEAITGIISDKSVEFIDRPENAIYRTFIFSPDKKTPEANNNN